MFRKSVFDTTYLNSSEVKKILYDNNEKVLAVLGNKYMQKYLETGNLTKGFALLSASRIHIIIDSKDSKREIDKKVFSIEDITEVYHSKELLTIIKISLVASILLAANSWAALNIDGYVMGIPDKYSLHYGYVSLFMSLICFSGIPRTVIKYHKIPKISKEADRIGFDVFLYRKSELDNFQQQLAVAREEKLKNIRLQRRLDDINKKCEEIRARLKRPRQMT